MPQLDAICYRVKPKIPGMGYILLVVGQRSPIKTLNVIGYFQCYWLPLQPGYKALLLKTLFMSLNTKKNWLPCLQDTLVQELHNYFGYHKSIFDWI